MKNQRVLLIIISICLSASFYVGANQGGGNHLVLNLVGSGDMYESFVPDIDGDNLDDPAICFDVELVNMKNRQVIGTATDCLSIVTPTGSGLALVGTTFFNMPNGTLITRGSTTVQPVLHPTVTPNGINMTHITGASSDGNSILDGTGRFKNATGTVRLSGMVNMTNFTGNVGTPISFDCLFIIDLD